MENPAGKGDSSTNRTVLRKELDTKYYKLRENPKKIFKVFFYRASKTDVYYIHVVIPSETERDNSYDIVFYFSDDTKTRAAEPSIINYDIKVFCNAPSFAYTFAKVYYDNNMLINELRQKYGRDIIKKLPEVRNRYNIVNYDKYTYFAAKYLHESRLLSKTTLNIRSTTYSSSMLKSSVRDLETIMTEYKKAANKLKRLRDKKKEQTKEAPFDSAIKGEGITRIIPKKPKVSEVRKKQPKTPMVKKPKSSKNVIGRKKKI